jgi:uncharacterized membrane protein SpoIIM required for sporulation
MAHVSGHDDILSWRRGVERDSFDCKSTRPVRLFPPLLMNHEARHRMLWIFYGWLFGILTAFLLLLALSS